MNFQRLACAIMMHSGEQWKAITRLTFVALGLLTVSNKAGAQTAEYLTNETTAVESAVELDSSLNETEYLERFPVAG